ncbi:hypothetical protein DPMN_058715 [Dreissena polymorpha]|uniref:Uncharacterized protein n=1 Tax=Dreissena polymorpha TaxID=45954 RepID=A0A9D4HFS4_DREPO|nr:hypothetical protein DPMN_058715 [Dreissena polymorpha]
MEPEKPLLIRPPTKLACNMLVDAVAAWKNDWRGGGGSGLEGRGRGAGEGAVKGLEGRGRVRVGGEGADKRVKQHSIFLSGLSWKKFTVNGNKKKDKNIFNRHSTVGILTGKVDNNCNIENININKNVQKSASCYNLKAPEAPLQNHVENNNNIKSKNDVNLKNNINNNHKITGDQKPEAELVQKVNKGTSPRKTVIQASTSELLKCLGEFLYRRWHGRNCVAPDR